MGTDSYRSCRRTCSLPLSSYFGRSPDRFALPQSHTSGTEGGGKAFLFLYSCQRWTRYESSTQTRGNYQESYLLERVHCAFLCSSFPTIEILFQLSFTLMLMLTPTSAACQSSVLVGCYLHLPQDTWDPSFSPLL